MVYSNMCDIVAVKLQNDKLILCAAAFGSFLAEGDRVIVSPNPMLNSDADVDGICASAAKSIDRETLKVINAAFPAAFPLRYIKARYYLEPISNPNITDESEVCNA